MLYTQDDDAASRSSRSSTSLIRQVVGALILVGLLQCVNVIVGYSGLTEIGGRSTEISAAGVQRMYVSVLEVMRFMWSSVLTVALSRQVHGVDCVPST